MRRSMIVAVGLLFLTGCAAGPVVPNDDPASPAAKSAPNRVATSNAPAPAMQGPVAVLGVPPGQYPPVGACRVWMPGTPSDQQKAPCSCFSLILDVPAGAWVLYRPSADQSVVQVTTYDEAQPNKIVSVDFYDAESGKYLRSAKL